jgi:hypothetical protein
MGMIVNGFIEPVTRTLPMEYAVEWSRLIELQMEGSVGSARLEVLEALVAVKTGGRRLHEGRHRLARSLLCRYMVFQRATNSRPSSTVWPSFAFEHGLRALHRERRVLPRSHARARARRRARRSPLP